MDLQDKKVLLGVSGGIAAYKAIELASMLYKSGAQIKTIMTDSARELVSAVNFSAITHGTVHHSQFHDSDPIPHINLADWADIVVIAPATANIMAKAANGIADDLLSSTLLACTSPILWIPAMNVHMYDNLATQDNIAILRKRGHFVLKPATGLLACGYDGKGKYPPNQEVIAAIKTYLHYGYDLSGKKILVTAGACSEDIDPMRCITNKSSGMTGLSIARAASLRGAEVSLVYADIKDEIPYHLSMAILAKSSADMHKAVVELATNHDTIIMCAAVSDYKPLEVAQSKIKKGNDISLDLIQTVDILKEVSKRRTSGQKIIGFAAETDQIEENAREKLSRKQLDLIVANDLVVAGKDHSEQIFISNTDTIKEKGDKFTLAHKLLDRINKL
ncbi:MAG: bifunctional phosphopantothenoylcysteine decarboxylase/phosphopantothenate--cysteine ligase CoaBC [Candidatus Cloacimonetes bacterium HGW-Cloacimonetes-2]|jgi:phosphopantothenoylcysteine decarboxylase/phosphopantothenate--cysteine ligase|nr:MAG: bifunctional phosphopantothenoylcysteine decarboxylase/phosphopantothenate--cysteine ligase CoaBC [Candidatus Cloacimonetes bacterium HGW-Cloacimonetes-2]